MKHVKMFKELVLEYCGPERPRSRIYNTLRLNERDDSEAIPAHYDEEATPHILYLFQDDYSDVGTGYDARGLPDGFSDQDLPTGPNGLYGRERRFDLPMRFSSPMSTELLECDLKNLYMTAASAAPLMYPKLSNNYVILSPTTRRWS